MENLIIVALILALLPSLLPSWRATFIALTALGFLFVIAFFGLLSQVDKMSNGEGPAFFSIVILYGISMTVMVGSCVAKAGLYAFFNLFSQRSKLLPSRILSILCLASLMAAVYANISHLASTSLVLLVGIPAIWLILALRLMPNKALKPLISFAGTGEAGPLA